MVYPMAKYVHYIAQLVLCQEQKQLLGIFVEKVEIHKKHFFDKNIQTWYTLINTVLELLYYGKDKDNNTRLCHIGR